MMADYKYRFLKMIKNHAPIKKAQVTRRGLAQLRIDMATLNGMITRYKNQGLIDCRKFPTPGRGGVVPEIYFITKEGKKWIKTKDKETRQAMKRLK